MIYGIFVKLQEKSSWKLFSRTVSAEAALSELGIAKEHAISAGYENAEAAIQTFETILWIPEYISKIDTNKSNLQYN